VPFDRLSPQWKVLRVNGKNPLQKHPTFQAPYPLAVSLIWESAAHPETQPWIAPDGARTFVNRDEQRMTVVAMTGVTAMVRKTAQLMDTKGITYPAKDIKPWFEDADLVHISNEASFKPDCVTQITGVSFCSHDNYIRLLEEIGANVIELTGNHLGDKGAQWVDHSLEMYRERGWHWFGGGATYDTAIQPLKLEHNGNRIAFIGCNSYVGLFAGENSGGAAPCSENFARTRSQIQELRAEGYQPIVTLQYREDTPYVYTPTSAQVSDFRSIAEAGPVMVQGSQAHPAQPMEFYNNTFIHYGLGNFFFDQMPWTSTRQEFVDRLTFYNNKLIGIELRTAILEEYGRPRPMTVGDPAPEADRAKFLEMIFALRPSP
jgi:poly-gamma-glutamate synthesis protein (capsule biosynthesis protein)